MAEGFLQREYVSKNQLTDGKTIMNVSFSFFVHTKSLLPHDQNQMEWMPVCNLVSKRKPTLLQMMVHFVFHRNHLGI